MKFDVLIKELLTEANVGSRGGHISIEQAISSLDTENDVNNFIRTSDPHFLIYPLMVASEVKYENKKIKFGKEYLSGMAFVNKVKEVFFTETSPNYINLPKTKDGQIATQAQFLKFARKAGKAGKAGQAYKEFSKTPEEYKTWGQLLTLVIQSSEFKEANLTQEQNIKRTTVSYINTEGQQVTYDFSVRPDDTISGTPFSSNVEFEDRSKLKGRKVQPMEYENKSYSKFLRDFKNEESVSDTDPNTFARLLDIIKGTPIGEMKNPQPKQKTLSLVQRMKLGLA